MFPRIPLLAERATFVKYDVYLIDYSTDKRVYPHNYLHDPLAIFVLLELIVLTYWRVTA